MYSFVQKLVIVSGSANTPPTIAAEMSLPCAQQTITSPVHLSYLMKLRFNIIKISLSDLRRPFPIGITDFRYWSHF